MKKNNIFIAALLMLFMSFNMNAQDNRTLTTKIADLLVQMPADNLQLRDKLMVEMEKLGVEGQKAVCEKIIAPGTGDDTEARFAVESYSRHLSLSKDEQLVKSWEKIILDMIESNSDSDVKSFFMQQLGYIGSDAVIEALTKYVTDKKLYDPSIRAMYMVSPDKAAAVFASKLSEAQGRPLIGLINIIGNSGQAQYADKIAGLFAKGDKDVKKAVIAALPKLAAPASFKLLKKEAAATGYTIDDLKATDNLLKYAANVKVTNPKECQKIAKTVLKKSSVELYGIDARLVLAECIGGEKGMDVLIAGMKNKDKKYRGAMIEQAVMMNAKPEKWIELLDESTDPEIKKEVLYLFARLRNPAVSDKVRSFIDNEDAGVRAEALKTFVILDHENAFPVTVDFMKKHTDPQDMNTADKVLREVLSIDNAKLLIDAFDELSPGMQAVALNAFGLRRVTDAFGLMWEALTNSDEGVKKAAFANLKNTATEKDIDALLNKFVKCSNPKFKKQIGEAVVAVVVRSGNRNVVEGKVLAFAEKSNTKDFIDIYAGLGGRQAAKAVSDLYKNGDDKTKAKALAALASWSDDNALNALYEICSTDASEADKESAFKSYVKHVGSSSMPDDQKLLLLRKIMPYANSTKDKKLVIQTLGGVKTFLTYVYLKQFLDDKDLQVDAANSLFKVILPSNGEDNGLKGKDVKETLEKVKELITGADSQYFKIDIDNYIKTMGDETGYVSMFNGKDLTGWKGFVANPIKLKEMSPIKRKMLQKAADKKMHENWSVKDGAIVFSGKGANLVSDRNDYGDYEMVVDWRITKEGDSGIYLRGTPQVQIWDTSRVEVGAQVGSGGLYNNQKHESKPLLVADNPIGDWNTFRIKIVGDKVTVYLNGKLVVDNVTMENYWDRKIPLLPTGPIELQAHGTNLAFRDIYVKELKPENHNLLTPEEKEDGYVLLFNGENLDGWVGNKVDYKAVDGEIVISGGNGSHGNLFTEKEYKDVSFKFEFKLTPGANNGIGMRSPLKGDAAYEGMEFQVLDNTADVYKNLKPYQYHGSLYGVLTAKRGFLKPVGEWNTEEIILKGTHAKVILNGHVILDGDFSDAIKNGTLDHKDHPGLKREKGHIGFLGHGSEVHFRNIKVKEL
jgi:HEAT repeat protein